MLCRKKKFNESKDGSWGPLRMSLPETERFKTGLDYGGGSRDAENSRYISEQWATGLSDGQGAKKEGDPRGLQGSGLSRWVESEVI